MDKEKLIQQFIREEKLATRKKGAYSSFCAMNHHQIRPIVNKIPKTFTSKLIHEMYYYYLLTGNVPKPTTELHYTLLQWAATDASKVLELYGYPRCALERWKMAVLFTPETNLQQYLQKFSLLQQAARFVHQPGVLAKKENLKTKWAQQEYLIKEIVRLLQTVPFIKNEFNKDREDIDLQLACILFILLLSENKKAFSILLQWFETGMESIRKSPGFSISANEYVRPNVWMMYRFADAANATVITQALLNQYGKDWCTLYG